jgi:hypothetical protein
MTTADTYPPAGLTAGDGQSRYLFLIEGLDTVDALMRVLGPFAVQQARVQAVVLTVADGRFVLRLEAEGLSADRAHHLRRRLAVLPLVTGVSIGWRNGSGAQRDLVGRQACAPH